MREKDKEKKKNPRAFRYPKSLCGFSSLKIHEMVHNKKDITV